MPENTETVERRLSLAAGLAIIAAALAVLVLAAVLGTGNSGGSQPSPFKPLPPLVTGQ